MKRFFVALFAFCSAFVMTQAQNAAQLFIDMPSDIAPALTKVNKEDMVDFMASKMKAVVQNKFGENVEMTALTDDYASVRTSSVGKLQLKTLPVNDSVKVVCLVNTVCPDACLSNIRFFSTDWKEFDREKMFVMPDVSAFVTRNDSVFMADSVAHSSLADINLYEYELSPNDNQLRIRCTIEKYVTLEEKPFMERWLKKEPVVMKWEDGKFVLVEE